MTHDSTSLLMGFGRDVATVFRCSPKALCRVDEHGWLGLTGEAGSADLNIAAVARGAPVSVLESYVGQIREFGLDAILIVDEESPELVAAAVALGLIEAGTVPVMVWEGNPAPVAAEKYTVRRARESDVAASNALVAEAFSLDEAMVQRAIPPSVLAAGADIWLVEEGDVLGTGAFVRSGDHVGFTRWRRPFDYSGAGSAAPS